MKRLAIYPGSFDPVTNGHLDILSRALRLFDNVILAVADNVSKNNLFTPAERAELLRQAVKDQPRVQVDLFSGLLVEYAAERKVNAIVRGLRAVADFEYEFQLALMNRHLQPETDTVFLMTDQRHFYVSSSLVKEIARFGGDVSALVPKPVLSALREKFGSNQAAGDGSG